LASAPEWGSGGRRFKSSRPDHSFKSIWGKPLAKGYLVCTGCQKKYSLDRSFPRCDDCFEPLEVKITSEEKFEKNTSLHTGILDHDILSKYASFYTLPRTNQPLSLKEGFTPLIQANYLSSILDLDTLYFKNETVNPTWSFKDRGTFICLNHAISLGYKQIGTVSSGNMAVSVAAYGARANLQTFILVSADMPLEKIQPILIYNPILIKVKGDYGQLYYESLKIGQEMGIYFLNSDVPFRVEGSKSIAFEICEQLNYDIPEYIIIPTSSGGNARGIIKGFLEFYQRGLISRLPKIICAQLEGCAPIYQAWMNNHDKISPIANPTAIDHAIANPFPPSGNELLRKLRLYDGMVITVSDQEALRFQRFLAKEGLFSQPAAAVALAAIKKLRDKGSLLKRDRCVAIITGSGLKYTGVLQKHSFTMETCLLNHIKEKIASILEK
jgi:threonine synthase